MLSSCCGSCASSSTTLVLSRPAGSASVEDAYWDRPDGALYMITSMREHRGALFLGGVTNDRIGRLALPGADEGWTGRGSYEGRA